MAPLDPRYTQVGFNLISIQVCRGQFVFVPGSVYLECPFLFGKGAACMVSGDYSSEFQLFVHLFLFHSALVS